MGLLTRMKESFSLTRSDYTATLEGAMLEFWAFFGIDSFYAFTRCDQDFDDISKSRSLFVVI